MMDQWFPATALLGATLAFGCGGSVESNDSSLPPSGCCAKLWSEDMRQVTYQLLIRPDLGTDEVWGLHFLSPLPELSTLDFRTLPLGVQSRFITSTGSQIATDETYCLVACPVWPFFASGPIRHDREQSAHILRSARDEAVHNARLFWRVVASVGQ